MMTAPPELPILTIREAADLLKVCERTILTWKAEGRLPAMPYPGRITRFRRRDCLALVGADLDRRPLITGAAQPA